MDYQEFEELLFENIHDLSNLKITIEELTENQLKNKDINQLNYLTNYFIIRACGTVEQAIKTLFYCHFKDGISNKFVVNYLESTLIINNSKNPSENMINTTLKAFDDSRKFQKVLSSATHLNLNQAYRTLDSLRNLRNQIAHGDRISSTFSIVSGYMDTCFILILEIQAALKTQYI